MNPARTSIQFAGVAHIADHHHVSLPRRASRPSFVWCVRDGSVDEKISFRVAGAAVHRDSISVHLLEVQQTRVVTSNGGGSIVMSLHIVNTSQVGRYTYSHHG